jgi:hypothetical protein
MVKKRSVAAILFYLRSRKFTGGFEGIQDFISPIPLNGRLKIIKGYKEWLESNSDIINQIVGKKLGSC